jgi:hypothetical protein
MNPIDLRVQFLDETETTVTCIAADLIAFESKFDVSVARLEKDLRLTYMFYLAWHVLKRTGETKLEFDKWTETVAAVGDGGEKK